MLTVLCAAVVIGICLGLFGSGGSILTVPVLLYLLQLPPAEAIASSLLIVGFISLFSSVRHLLQKKISKHHLLWFGIPGMLATYLGAWAGTQVSSHWQLMTFSLLMLLAAAMMWRNRPATTATTATTIVHPVLLALNGLAAGVLTGFVGVGGGFLIVPALIILGGLQLQRATATSLAIISLQALTGFAGYYTLSWQGHTELQLNWQVIIPMVIAGITGSYAGGLLSNHLPRLLLQRSFALFLIIMASIVIYRSVLPT